MNNTVRAISLWQPWASLCVLGLKQYETRSWTTPYRGTLVIHAAKRWDFGASDTLAMFMDRFHLYAHQELYDLLQGKEARWLGAALGTVELTGIFSSNDRHFVDGMITEREQAFGNYAPNRYAWQLENPRKFPQSIPYRGKQGLWTWDMALPEAQGIATVEA